jgi:hypothetical protein
MVGGGPAGMSAALVLARARRKVLVVDSGEPRNALASHMHGFLYPDGLLPAELLSLGRIDVVGYGGEIVVGSVTELVPSASGFGVLQADGQRFSTRRVLIARGCAVSCPRSRVLPSGGRVIFCIAPTATVMKSVTNCSEFWMGHLGRSVMHKLFINSRPIFCSSCLPDS